jgi:hypothetical protein
VQERINIINSNSSNQVASLEIVKEAKGADFVTNVIITLPPTSKTEYPDA